MADQRNSNQRRRSASAQRGAPRSDRRGTPSRRRRPQKKTGFDLSWLSNLRPKPDFKPDREQTDVVKHFHLTQVQRDTLAKWGLYTAVIIVLLTIQDVIMSQVHLFGATTDLAVCAILLITVIEGVENGSLFVFIAACLYYFSGSSPGPYSIALLVFLGIGACLFRQLYWHRNRASIVLCAGLALMLYEVGTFAVGIFSGLTRWDTLLTFVITGIYSCIVMIPLYTLIGAIGQIGGNTWKE